MADVMAERVRSIQRCVGVTFLAGALFLTFSIIAQPSFDDVNRADQVLALLTKHDWTAWMMLHAVMILGFALVTIGFAAFAFLLHLRGSSGSAAVITVSAILGGALWIGFFAAELYGYRYLTNLYTIDPSRATELFSTVWFWKLGAMVVAALLTFLAVAFAGATGTARGVLPVWLGWGGTLFAVGGLVIYTSSFLGSTATGAAINPIQSAGVRYGIGLPLQVWVLGVGTWMMRAFLLGVPMAPPAPPVSRPARPAPPAPPETPEPPPAPPRSTRPPGAPPHPALPPDA